LALRGILRGTAAAAFITLSTTVSGDTWGGPGWAGKLAHVSDGCITLAGFSGTSLGYLTCNLTLLQSTLVDDPIASLSFPNHHGLVKVSSSPAPGTLRAPSITRSILRGMTSSGVLLSIHYNNISTDLNSSKVLMAAARITSRSAALGEGW
jgi:hypothetical protein